jgi:hypothetical protein
MTTNRKDNDMTATNVPARHRTSDDQPYQPTSQPANRTELSKAADRLCTPVRGMLLGALSELEELRAQPDPTKRMAQARELHGFLITAMCDLTQLEASMLMEAK